MKRMDLVKFAFLMAVLFLQLACLNSPAPNPEPIEPLRISPSSSSTPTGQLNITGGSTSSPSYNPGYNAGAAGTPVVTPDGRVLLLRPGTWEVISPAPQTAVMATTPNGQRVMVMPDGTWVPYGGSRYSGRGGGGRGAGTKPPIKPPPPPPPGVIYFYQLGGEGGSGKATVFMDNRPVAALRAKRFFAIRVPPGRYMFTVSKSAQSPVMMTVAPGRTYFMRNVGGFMSKEKLVRESTAQGQADINKLTVIRAEDVDSPDIMFEPIM